MWSSLEGESVPIVRYTSLKDAANALNHNREGLKNEALKQAEQHGLSVKKPESGTRGYKAAIANNEEARRSHEEILNDMRDALPNGSFEQQDNGDYEISMPNGAKIGLNIKGRIIVNASEEARAKASHGINQEEDIVIEGSWEKLTGKMLNGFLNLSRESRKGTAFHEVFHAAWDLALTKREQSALLKYFTKIAKEQGRDVYEVMADAYADWELARRRERSSTFGKLWQKVKDFARRLRNAFTGMDNLHDIMQRIESGKVWEESGGKRVDNSNTRYSVTNSQITGETRIPVIDITDLPKVDVNSSAAKKEIAKSLIGKTFRIIGSNGIGRVASVSNGRHLVHPSNNPVRTASVRRRALSNIDQLLNNAIYVEKHDDRKHGSAQKYIELYTAVKNNNGLIRFRIVAKEGDNAAGEYEVKDAKFYDIIKDGAFSANTSKGVSPARIPLGKHRQVSGNVPSTVSVAELLANVKDRNGKPYINEYGGLNYENEALRGIRYSVVKTDKSNTSNQGSNADPDVAALRKKYKDKLDKAYARNATSSEIAEIMNKYQEELVKLYERKNLERKEKSRIRAAELRELRRAFKAGEINRYQVGGVTIYRDEAGNESVEDVNDDFAARTYVNRRREGKTFANATQKIDDTIHSAERKGLVQKGKDFVKNLYKNFYRNWIDKYDDLGIFDKAVAEASLLRYFSTISSFSSDVYVFLA